MKLSLRPGRLPAALAALAAAQCAHAQPAAGQRWYWSMDLQGLAGGYSGSTARESLANGGVFLHGDYFERGGLSVGYSRTALGFEDGGGDVGQDNVFVSGRLAFTPDALAGRLTLRLDGYDVANDADADVLGALTAGAAQVSYVNFARTLYWDLGLARSEYGRDASSGQGFDLDQLTPTIGFAWGRQRDWLQLRAYLIDAAATELGALPDDTSAVEVKWTHWLPPNGALGLEGIRASILVGERLFAVDHDVAAIYNLSELQTGGASVGGEWRVGDRSSVLLIAGIEDFENRESLDSYRNAFLYLNFSYTWN